MKASNSKTRSQLGLKKKFNSEMSSAPARSGRCRSAATLRTRRTARTTRPTPRRRRRAATTPPPPATTRAPPTPTTPCRPTPARPATPSVRCPRKPGQLFDKKTTSFTALETSRKQIDSANRVETTPNPKKKISSAIEKTRFEWLKLSKFMSNLNRDLPYYQL